MMTTWEQDFIFKGRIARLATVDTDGQPHLVPVVYAFADGRLYTPIDAKPKRVSPIRLQRVRNIQADQRVAVIIDQYSEDWRQLAWVQIRGVAELVETGPEQSAGVALLSQKYPQYQTMPLDDCPVIVITPRHVASWRAAASE